MTFFHNLMFFFSQNDFEIYCFHHLVKTLRFCPSFNLEIIPSKYNKSPLDIVKGMGIMMGKLWEGKNKMVPFLGFLKNHE